MAKQTNIEKHFELYLLGDRLTAGQWLQFYNVLLPHLGLLGSFSLTFHCANNVVRYFVSCRKDISPMSNGLDGILLRPVDRVLAEPLHVSVRERLVQYVTGGNLLDLKEKMHIKKAKDLQYARFNVKSLGGTRAIVQSSLYFKDRSGAWSYAQRLITSFPAQLLAVDLTANAHYLKKSVPRYLDIERSLHLLASDRANALFEVDAFPYFSHHYYLNLTNYDFDRHSFIIGASGSGKSKLISLLVDRLYRTALKLNYRVVVIDPHASIAQDFSHITESKVINFSGESTELFSGASTDISAATELTATLLKSLMGDQYNAKTDRVLRFSLFVLFTAQTMSLDTLKRFLTDIDLRNQIIQHVSAFVPANIIHFFGADFNEMRTKFYNEAISPIVSLIDEMQLQPALVGEGDLSLIKTIQDNFLTVFSLNKVSMGERVVKTVAGLLIQQIFLLAQARMLGQKVILIIDEVSIVQNPALASILAEARKFNLSVILTQQYFGQIEKNLRDAIFANVYNYYAFKVSEEDARSLEGNLSIDLPKEVMAEEHKKGLKEQDVRIKIMTELHPRECLIRVLANGQMVPAIKARTIDAPISTASVVGASNQLRAYQQAAPALPKKFYESSPVTVETATPFAHSKTAPTPFDSQEAAKLHSRFNLSEMLAEHSSSRIHVTKRKDKS